MRKGYESKHLGQGSSCAKGRQLRKAQWRKLALGVALMTGCWQLGWMPMTEAADVAKKEITQEVLNTEDTIKDYTQEATNLTTTDGGVFAAATGAGGLNGPGGGKTITLTNNTVHLTGATIHDTRDWHEPNVVAARVTLGNNQSGSQNESYVLSGNAITLDGTITTTGKTGGRLEGAWILCNGTYEATAITATDNSVTINADTASSSIGSFHIAGAEIGTANTSLAEGNKVKIKSGNFTNGNLIIAGALPSDRAGEYSNSLRAIGNTVEISGGQFAAGIKIVGAIERRGTQYFHEASQNVVTIRGGTFDADTTIIGGKGTTANDNIVNINAAIKVKSITGGDGTTSTGNTLNLGKTGIEVTGAVSKAQTIAITNGVTFADGATVLNAGSISDMGTLDISANTFSNDASGTMTLLKSGSDLGSFKLKYGSGEATLSHTNTKQVVGGASESKTENGVSLDYNNAHTVELVGSNYNQVDYTITNTMNADISGWTGVETALPDDWEKPAGGITIEGTGFTKPGTTTNILTSNVDGFFDDAAIDDDIKYKQDTDPYVDADRNITLSGTQSQGVQVTNSGKNLTYSIDRKIDTIQLGEIDYEQDSVWLDRSSSNYNYADVTALDTSNFNMSMTDEQAAAARNGDSMTLLKANDTLVDIDEQVAGSVINYSDTPADGVTETGTITGSVKASGGNVTYTVTDKRASNLTFGAVNWTGSDALVTRPDGVSYADATVDATNISFSGVKNLTVGDAMTLIGAYDGDTLNAQGEKFTAGMSVVGTGKMSLDDDGNVIYTVSSVSGSEQSHNTLMGAAASIAALSMGNEFIDSAMEGLALPENIGKDGISCYAKIGGGKLRQQTGSHVNVNTWNAILALGHKNEQKKSTTEYGAFFEYGRGNYTTHNDNVQNGDGKAHYTGGGLLGKWASKDGLYVEGSFRAGNVREDAQNLLRDDTRAYSYNTSATYYGFHLGVGKQLAVAKDSVVDVYGKYFYNHKNGVDFTVNGDQYKIDALTSQVARLGVRYTLKRDKWNFYGDLAYEHELDGKAKGRVNGATIRGTDTSGGSARLELGATLLPTEKSPWSLDLNATGFAGKKRGISGGVSLKYLF